MRLVGGIHRGWLVGGIHRGWLKGGIRRGCLEDGTWGELFIIGWMVVVVTTVGVLLGTVTVIGLSMGSGGSSLWETVRRCEAGDDYVVEVAWGRGRE